MITLRVQNRWKILKVYDNIDGFKALNPVVTIGIFDGVHYGHTRILNRIKYLSAKSAGETVVVTLWPHPRQVLGDNNIPVQLLSTLEEKIKLIEQHNIDHLIILPFTKDFANITFGEFIENYLVKGINASYIVIGYNHHFGKDRKGGFEQLKLSAGKYGFEVERLDPIILDNIQVSSSAIRNLILKGDVAKANLLLNYKYTFTGKVVEGKKLGKLLGFPTANIQVIGENKLLPPIGVYAVFVEIDNIIYGGMMNIGYRPTIEEQIHRLTIEVNIFDFNQNVYGNKIRISFVDRIRDEQRFNNKEELILQLKQDKKSSLDILKKDR